MNFSLSRNVRAEVVLGLAYVTVDPETFTIVVEINSGFGGYQVIIKDSKGHESMEINNGGTGTSYTFHESGSLSLSAGFYITGVYSETAGIYSKASPINIVSYIGGVDRFPEYLDENNIEQFESDLVSPNGDWTRSSGIVQSDQPKQLWPSAEVDILGKKTNITLESSWDISDADDSLTYQYTPSTADGSYRVLNTYFDQGILHLWQSEMMPNSGQNRTYNGRVLDYNGNGLSEANVTLGGHKTSTDDNGAFSLEAYDGDGIYFEASKEGYWTQRITNEPLASGTLNFTLAKNVVCPVPIGGVFYHLENETRASSIVSYSGSDVVVRVSGSGGGVLDMDVSEGGGTINVTKPMIEGPSSYLVMTSVEITGDYWETPGEIESFSAVLSSASTIDTLNYTDYMSIEGARNLTFVKGGPSEETIQFYMSGSQAWPIALSPEVVIDVLGKNTIVRPGIQLMAGDGGSSDNASSIKIILQIQDGDGVGAFSCYSENGFLIHVWETSSPP